MKTLFAVLVVAFAFECLAAGTPAAAPQRPACKNCKEAAPQPASWGFWRKIVPQARPRPSR
jgi:hypothetical protein